MYKHLSILTALLFFSCASNAQNEPSGSYPIEDDSLEVAYFASGCFWCVEAIFESVEGVNEAISGYAGGSEKNPTYKEVSYGKTTHAEAVAVYYDPSVISFQELLTVFFVSHDPTTLNRQGPDRGAQYRSIAFYSTAEEKRYIDGYIQALNDSKVYKQPIVTEVKQLDVFYEAEAYHQNYEKNHPYDSYIQGVSIPRLNRFKAALPKLLKSSDAHEH